MRTITLLLCATLISSGSFAQSKEIRDVSTFTEISYRVPGHLYLRQGSPQKVELVGDSETLREIETTTKGNRLVIENEDRNSWFSWGNDSHDKIDIYITMENIEGLFVSGSGKLLAETAIKGEYLDLKVSGSGYLEVQTNLTGDLRADVSGSGDLKVKGNCQHLTSSISGSGKIYIANAIEGTAKFSVSGSGKVLASGRAQLVKADISGSGKVIASDLQTERCQVSITGSGDVEINVKNELDARISGSGSVSYKGNPSQVNAHSSGSGKVRRIQS